MAKKSKYKAILLKILPDDRFLNTSQVIKLIKRKEKKQVHYYLIYKVLNDLCKDGKMEKQEVLLGEKAPAVVAKYAEENLLMSGFLSGEKYLHDKASAVEVPLGRGRVIVLGFGVQHRGQPHATFKLLFNSLYYGAAQ